jgi:deoxyribonuclease-4
LRIGIHTSTSKSLEGAALKAHELGANCFQIFSASPRMWRASKPVPAAVELLRKAREKHDLTPLVIHANYLANLASLEPKTRALSVASFRGELERAAMIGAEYLVLHPGNYKNQSREEGIAAFVLGLAEAAEGVPARGLTVLFENTVGSGHQLGSKFEELRMIRDLAKKETHLATGYCLDTCHLLAAGFEITTSAGLDSTLAHAEGTLGMENVRVIHANDSKGALASHLDRHENIGNGAIGEAAFARILTHPLLREKPFILETPVDDDAAARRDVAALWRLSKQASKADDISSSKD